ENRTLFFGLWWKELDNENLTEGLKKLNLGATTNGSKFPSMVGERVRLPNESIVGSETSKNVLGPHNDPRLRSIKKETLGRESGTEKFETASADTRSALDWLSDLNAKDSLEVSEPNVMQAVTPANSAPSAVVVSNVGVTSAGTEHESRVPGGRKDPTSSRAAPVNLAKSTRPESQVAPMPSAEGKIPVENGVVPKWESPVQVLSVEGKGDDSAQRAIPARNPGVSLANSEDYVNSRVERQAKKGSAKVLGERVEAQLKSVDSGREANNAPSVERKEFEMLIPSVREWSHPIESKNSSAGETKALGSLVTAQSTPGTVDLSSPALMAMRVGDLASRGGGSIRIRVMPEHLGEVTISVSNHQGKLKVALDADNAEAQALLSRHAPELKGILEASRFQVDRIDVNRETGLTASSSWLASSPVSTSVGSSVSSVSSGQWTGLSNSGNQGGGQGSGFDQSRQDGFMRWDDYNSQWQDQMNGREERARKLWQYAQANA
ncbi:MAG TPA: flagellar hook-length control protein FliK, partial [Oligoflexia bacterium]|nr:flagellar hook-length control protein FliK [Oligoflexia bacterium]